MSSSEAKTKKKLSLKLPKNKWTIPLVSFVVLVTVSVVSYSIQSEAPNQPAPLPVDSPSATQSGQIKLPNPSLRSQTSIEAALKNIRARRSYADESVTLQQASQLLWAAQGVTVDWGDRTTPSAKSTYPLTVYLVANKVDDLNPGLYKYIPGERQPIHALEQLTEGQYQQALFNSLNQNSMKNPAGVIVVVGDMVKMANAYGGAPHDREVYLEAGHATQNVYLQAESLKLGVVALSNFEDSTIRNIISIPERETLIYLIPFGQIKD